MSDTGFGMMLPFVTVMSKGGPHEDNAYAARQLQPGDGHRRTMNAPQSTKRTLSCWLFGHRFARPDTRGQWRVVSVDGKPLFECRCGVIWAPLRTKVFRHQLVGLGHRDRFARYDLR